MKYNIKLLYYFFFFLAFPLNSLSAQHSVVDSLVLVLSEQSEDSTKVNLYNQLSWEFHRTDIERSLEYGHAALQLGERLAYQKGIGRALNLLAIVYGVKGDTETSITYNERCLEIGQAIQNSFLIEIATNDLGISYSQKGENDKALELFQQSLRLAEKSGDILGQAFTLGNIAHLLEANNHPEAAQKYFEQATEMAIQSDDPMVLCGAYFNLGRFHQKEKNFREAIRHFEQAYDLAASVNDKMTMSDTRIELGKISLEQGEEKRAFAQAQEAVALAKELGETHRWTARVFALATMYKKTGRYPAALQNYHKSLELATQYGAIELKKDIYRELSVIYEQIGDLQHAFQYNKYFHQLKDSLFTKEKINYIAELEEKYQSEKKDSENALLKVEKMKQQATIEKQKIMTTAMGLIAILALLLGLVIYRALQSKKASHRLLEQKVKERTTELQESNHELKRSNEELERFAHIASHDLKEPLRNISSFIKLLRRELTIIPGTDAHEYMSFVLTNTRQMHSLIEDVLEYSTLTSNAEELELVDLNETIEQIKSALASTIQEKGVSLEINNLLPSIRTHSSKMYFLFKNLIENGIKFNQNEAPKLKISYRLREQFHHFSIKDNGIGIEEEYFQRIFEMFKRLHNRKEYEGTGLGLSLCKKIVNTYGGEIGLESIPGKGTTFHFTMPVDEIPGESKQAVNAMGDLVEMN